MAEEKKTFHCHINTPDGEALAGEYVAANIPALDGYIGILPDRAPLSAVVTTGMISLASAQGKSEELFVGRGFMLMRNNTLTVLTEECAPISKLDPERAWDLLQQAYALPKVTDEQVAYRDEMIQAERIRFNLAQKSRKKMLDSEDVFSRGLT